MALSIVVASIVGDEEVDETLDTLDDKHDNGLEGHQETECGEEVVVAMAAAAKRHRLTKVIRAVVNSGSDYFLCRDC